ncbi:P-II family nitrogen regulator [Sphingomonas arenae]|uniref:P-II family nitrogen regulator n=1 Tax=Sphingomonas arenae TaxID=2812555 RepID=UPI001968236C
MQTVIRKRIEILGDAALVPRIVAALKDAGVHGHTVLPVLSGSGSTGDWSEDRLTGSEKRWIVAIASEAHARGFVETLAPMLDSHRLLLTIGDVEVVRGDRF